MLTAHKKKNATDPLGSMALSALVIHTIYLYFRTTEQGLSKGDILSLTANISANLHLNLIIAEILVDFSPFSAII